MSISSAPDLIDEGKELFKASKFSEAKEKFLQAQELESDNATCKTWIRKCDAEISPPPPPVPAQAPPAPISTATPSLPPTPPAAAAPTSGKIRYDFCQNPQFVSISIYAKNVDRTKAETKFTPETAMIVFPLPAGNSFSLDLDLAFPIIPEQSSVQFFQSKVELKLKKRDPLVWPRLERSDAYSGGMDGNSAKPAAPAPPAPSAPTSAPAPAPIPPPPAPAAPVGRDPKRLYPSSKGDKDWDEVSRAFDQELAEDKSKMSGDESLNKLFQQIYKDADEDTRRAMMKSFSESGGTVLSTNWSEVGKKRVKPSPPAGMEARRWEK